MTEKIYTIGNMDCANCAREVEEGVKRLDGVESVRVDFMTEKMYLQGDVPYPQLEKRVQDLGKRIVPLAAAGTPPEPLKKAGIQDFWAYLLSSLETRLALIGGAVILLGLLLNFLSPPEGLQAGVYIAGMLIGLYPILRSGLKNLLINHSFNINLLMSIAAIGAILIGEYLEGATVIFLFAIGEALEGYTSDKARQSIKGLMSLKPASALRIEGKSERQVPVEALEVGDEILVKAGEGIPMDGLILEGKSAINQAAITGESVAVLKSEGERVYAGTINGEGSLKLKITALAADNTLNRIIKLVEETQSQRAPSQRLVDRFAEWYTPAVMVIALLVALIPPLLFGAPFYDTAAEQGWLYRALTILVIACPCALVISTPVTVISAISAAAKRGVLIKGGLYLETLAGVKVFAFDKTGTLTEGKPKITSYRQVDCEVNQHTDCCDDLIALASAVERRAKHPIAEALVSAAEERNLTERYEAAEGVEVLSGKGVRGSVEQREITLGSHAYFDQSFPHDAAFCQEVQDLEATGQSTFLVADGDDVRGYIALQDQTRPSSVNLISQLKALDIKSIMLSGDHQAVAERIAAELGLDEVKAGLLPDEKLKAINELKARYQEVAMVGDGINDTPALAGATVGIAMGGAGSQQALESADIALMADDLSQLPYTIRLSRFTKSLIRQNITLSFGIKFVLLILAFFGLTSLWVAILADVGMSLVVTLNGMRPLRFEKPADLQA
ncbi:heavy metal translocating P-type ATPase [Anaerolineales bacterium]